jgi:membrane-bound serine protease (ClpP class)
MWIGPNTAFCLVIFGLLAIYCEFIWPGRVMPGVSGVAGVLVGGYFLWQAAPTMFGLEMLSLAAALFALDAFVGSFGFAGAAGTTATTVGFLGLFEGPHEIKAALAIPWCVFFGAVTTALNWTARRARRNKWLDLVSGD